MRILEGMIIPLALCHKLELALVYTTRSGDHLRARAKLNCLFQGKDLAASISLVEQVDPMDVACGRLSVPAGLAVMTINQPIAPSFSASHGSDAATQSY